MRNVKAWNLISTRQKNIAIRLQAGEGDIEWSITSKDNHFKWQRGPYDTLNVVTTSPVDSFDTAQGRSK